MVGYRLSRVTAFVAKQLLRFNVPHISPVNLVLEERLVPELLQDGFRAEAIVEAAEPLLRDGPQRRAVLAGYDRLRSLLGSPGVTDRAAAAILDQVGAPGGRPQPSPVAGR